CRWTYTMDQLRNARSASPIRRSLNQDQMYGATNTGIRVPPPFIPALIDGEIGRFKPEGHLDLAQVQTNAISGAGAGPLLPVDRWVAGSTPISETSVGPEKESRRTVVNASHGE